MNLDTLLTMPIDLVIIRAYLKEKEEELVRNRHCKHRK